MADDNVLSTCEKCGEPRFVMRNEKKVQLRCRCDWERGFHHRVKTTIHPTFWKDEVKTLNDWSPPIFRGANGGEFRSFIRIQKAMAMAQMYEFCFRQDPSPAIYGSMAKGRNLFIRGPQGSGRGLLAASVKMYAAIRDISVTPLPADWSDYRSKLQEAEAFGKDGDLARALLIDEYVNVGMMVLENIRGERRKTYKGGDTPWKSRFSSAIDATIGRREMRQGSMLLTSAEFAGEILDTLGDKLHEALDSPKTMPILMLSAMEAGELLRTMRNRQAFLISTLAASKGGEKKKARSESMMENYGGKQDTELVKESFYFGEAFKNVPASFSGKKLADSLTTELVMISKDYPAETKRICGEFMDERNANGLAYKSGLRSARLNVIKACKELASKMTEREMDIVGRMMSMATDDAEKVDEVVKKAIGLRSFMSGEKDNNAEG